MIRQSSTKYKNSKDNFKRICALLAMIGFACIAITLAVAPNVVAKASVAGIAPLTGYSVKASEIKDGYKYVNYTSKDSNDKQTQSLFYGEANLKNSSKKYKLVQHSIQSASGGFTAHSVMDLAKDYENKTNDKVIFAINGTFFFWENKVLKSNFAFMRNGELVKQTTITEWSANTGLGWNENGNVVLGAVLKNKISLQFDSDKSVVAITKQNAAPRRGEIAIVTEGSLNVADTFNAYRIPVSKKLDRELLGAGAVKEIFTAMYGGAPAKHSGAQLQVSGDEFYIVVGKDTVTDKRLEQYTGNLNFIATPSGGFDGVTSFAGANNTLVKGGELMPIYIPDINPTKSHEGQLCGRTTMGFKADGTPFFAVSDGRQPGYAVGVNVRQQAKLAAELGAQTAVELDGGGSSTFIMRKDDKLEMMNTPDDKDDVGRPEARIVIDAILLVEVEQATQPPVDPEPPVPPVITPDPVKDVKGCNKKASESAGILFGCALLLCTVFIKKI